MQKGIAGMLPDYVGPADSQELEAILSSNEKWHDYFISRVRRHKPDGYIYGAGAGGVLATIEGMRYGKDPKGIIIVNLNPAVILGAKILRKGFGRYDSWEDFLDKIILNRRSLLDMEAKILETESNEKLRKLMKKYVNNFRLATDTVRKGVKGKEANYPLRIVERRYPTFRQLAADGNIAVILSNITDPKLLNKVHELPGFSQSNNIIYLSNISNYPTAETANIRILDPETPHRNVIIEANKESSFELMKYTSPSRGQVLRY